MNWSESSMNWAAGGMLLLFVVGCLGGVGALCGLVAGFLGGTASTEGRIPTNWDAVGIGVLVGVISIVVLRSAMEMGNVLDRLTLLNDEVMDGRLVPESELVECPDPEAAPAPVAPSSASGASADWVRACGQACGALGVAYAYAASDTHQPVCACR